MRKVRLGLIAATLVFAALVGLVTLNLGQGDTENAIYFGLASLIAFCANLCVIFAATSPEDADRTPPK